VTTPDDVTLIRRGDRRAIARLIRDLDDGHPAARQTLRDLQQQVAGAPSVVVVGITGGPGAGKSTLVDALIAHWRHGGERVGVVAIDPSSAVAGGAVLGDRIRMQRHAMDAGVFIRSLASRGDRGGLSRSAMNVAAVLTAAGFTRVVVETLGAGQAEVDIAAAADVTVVVMTPGMGDDIQTLKAGLLEIADVLVLNKADRPGAEAAVRDLQAMLGLRLAAATAPAAAGDIAITKTVATTGEGVPALAAAIDTARAAGLAGGAVRLRRRAEARIRTVLTTRLDAAARVALAPGGAASSLADDVAALRLDPESAADVLMARLAGRY
jgi:LAO/AO transport system kinase